MCHALATPQQPRNVAMPASGVEIGNTLLGLVRDAGPLQVLLHHQPGPPLRELGKQRLVWLQSHNPFTDHRDQVRVQRQDVLTPVLRGCCGDNESRLCGIQVKAANRQTRQLGAAQARHVRQDVDPRSHLARVALNNLAAARSGLNQLDEFFFG